MQPIRWKLAKQTFHNYHREEALLKGLGEGGDMAGNQALCETNRKWEEPHKHGEGIGPHRTPVTPGTRDLH